MPNIRFCSGRRIHSFHETSPAGTLRSDSCEKAIGKECLFLTRQIVPSIFKLLPSEHSTRKRMSSPRLERPEARCQGRVSPALPLFLFRQYDETHEFLRDGLPIRSGSHHLRAQEVAGDRTPGREVYE